MAKKRGNPNWGKPDPPAAPASPSSFEAMVQQLRLCPGEYANSAALKDWASKNKDHKYIPDDLLKFWGFEVKGDL